MKAADPYQPYNSIIKHNIDMIVYTTHDGALSGSIILKCRDGTTDPIS